MTKPPRRTKPPNWSRKLGRVIMLDDGRQLRTLDDVRAVIIEVYGSVNVRFGVLNDVIRLLFTAAEKGKRDDVVDLAKLRHVQRERLVVFAMFDGARLSQRRASLPFTAREVERACPASAYRPNAEADLHAGSAPSPPVMLCPRWATAEHDRRSFFHLQRRHEVNGDQTPAACTSSAGADHLGRCAGLVDEH